VTVGRGAVRVERRAGERLAVFRIGTIPQNVVGLRKIASERPLVERLATASRPERTAIPYPTGRCPA